MDVFNLGQRIRILASITDSGGDPADPSGDITVTIKAPRTAPVSYVYDTEPEVVRDSEGEYHMDLTLSAPGVWVARWVTAGDLVVSSGDTRFRARETVTDG